MITLSEAWQAGIDAVVADNSLNRGQFTDAMQTVITDGLSQGEGNDYVNAVAEEFERLGLINNPTYNNLRADIIDDPVKHRLVYDALLGQLNALPEADPVLKAIELTNLRDERDNVDNAIDRLDALIAAEPGGTVGRLVIETMRNGKGALRTHKQALRDQIRNITGDPDI
jgi:hypothetical protein